MQIHPQPLAILSDERAAAWPDAAHEDTRTLIAPFDAEAFGASADPASRRTATTR
jgi:hypothetical protein